jgi:hypothetical protein
MSGRIGKPILVVKVDDRMIYKVCAYSRSVNNDWDMVTV